MSAEEPNRPACAGHDPELFFPQGKTGSPSAQDRALIAFAKSICGGCPTAAFGKCREAGIREHRDGIWGGLDPAERVNIRRERGISLPIRRPWEAALRELSMDPAAVQTRARRAREKAQREVAA